MQAINADEKGNEHFVDDYNLSVPSVVLSQVEHGKEKRWKNLDRVWTLLEEQEQLWEYLLQALTRRTGVGIEFISIIRHVTNYSQPDNVPNTMPVFLKPR